MTWLRLVREHGRIENGLHGVRDVTMGADGCRVRSGQAPQVLAALRNVVVHLWSQETRHAELGVRRSGVRQHLAARPHEALKILGLPQLE